MKKTIISSICVLMALSGCSGTETSSKAQLSENTSGIRVSDGYIEYQDGDGNWQQLIAIDELKGEDGKDGKDGTDGVDGKNGTNGVNGTNGKDGVNGTNGTNGINGKDGTNGTNGKDGADGKDGTQVTVDENGYLVLDGISTGWKLSSASSSANTYSFDENGYLCLNGEKTKYHLVADADPVVTPTTTVEPTVDPTPTPTESPSTLTLETPTITTCELYGKDQIRMKWDSVENADYYQIYIDGEVVIIDKWSGNECITYSNYATIQIPPSITQENMTIGVKAYAHFDHSVTLTSSEMATANLNVDIARCDKPTITIKSNIDGSFDITIDGNGNEVDYSVTTTKDPDTINWDWPSTYDPDVDRTKITTTYTPSKLPWYSDVDSQEETVYVHAYTKASGDLARSDYSTSSFTATKTK